VSYDQDYKHLKRDLVRWEVIFDVSALESRFKELEQRAAEANLWENQEEAQQVLRERSTLEDQLTRYEKLQTLAADSETYCELYEETKDENLLSELEQTLDLLERNLEDFELEKMLSGAHDASDAIIEINSGAGGTEAQDWGEMLLRMYTRWAERRNFDVELVSINPGEEAGIKSATLVVKGRNAYGYTRAEAGVHRLVRISPFDSNARRHTSFASVAVTPDIQEDIDIEIKDEDLRVDTYRASGAGGQHINKTDSAVRLTHHPSGIVVACQNERSQHKNKARAMALLKAKLYDLEQQKQRDEIDKITGERQKIDFGSQIRSYVMQPYQIVKDVRSQHETSDVSGVLDGDLDEFIRAYLMKDLG